MTAWMMTGWTLTAWTPTAWLTRSSCEAWVTPFSDTDTSRQLVNSGDLTGKEYQDEPISGSHRVRDPW
jgi:hypothetical protein